MAGWSLLKETAASWHVSLSASGPAGGQFGGMPSIIAWLIDRDSRPIELRGSAKEAAFDLSEWARLTRLEPARCLGLPDVGHLRVGARANIALYDLKPGTGGEETLSALANCWCLIKDGVLVREGGTFTGQKPPAGLRCPEIDEDLSGLAQTDLFQNTTRRFENLGAFPSMQAQADRP